MHLRVAGALLTLLVLAGCSSSTKPTAAPSGSNPTTTTSPAGTAASTTTAPTTTAPAPLDPCEVVTQAQATSLAGTEMLPGLAVRTDSSTDSTCTYTPPPDGPKAQVEVLLRRAAEADTAHEATITFREGDTWVTVRVTNGEDPAVVRTRLRALAKQISP